MVKAKRKLEKKKPAREKTMQERVIERLRKMSVDERFDLMVKAGIYTRNGKLMPNYQGID